MYSDDDLKKKLQLCQFIILLEFKRICDKHNINYSLLYGTLLGAVRHKGFIPWDDDVDVGMLRSDYNKFISICKDELSSMFSVQTTSTEPMYPHVPSRLLLNGTTYRESCIQDFNIRHQIYLDIYVFDNSPSNPDLVIQQSYDVLLLRIKRRVSQNLRNQKRLGNLPPLSRVRDWFRRFIVMIRYNDRVMNYRIDKILQQYNSQDTKYVVPTGGMGGFINSRIEKTSFQYLRSIQFEDVDFQCFKDYSSILSRWYGDYMTPPPTDKRIDNSKNLIELDLGEYSDIGLLYNIIEKYRRNLSHV